MSHRTQFRMGAMGGLFLLGLASAPAVAAQDADGKSSGAAPRVVMFVVPAESSADLHAAYINHLFMEKLKGNESFVLVDADEAAGEKKDTRALMEKAQRLFENGKKAYENLELKDVTKFMQQATAELDLRLGDLENLDLYSDTLIYQGAALVLQGEQAKGKRLFTKLLILNKKAELNPMVFPPVLTASFKSAAADIPHAGSSTLDIRPTPAGSEIWIDGIYRGVGPLRVDRLIEGEHLIRVVHTGYVSVGQKRTLAKGKEAQWSPELKPLPSTARIQKLVQQVLTDATGGSYPPAIDDLMRSLNAERLLLLRVASEKRNINVKAAYLDQVSQSCLHHLESVFDPKEPAYQERLVLFFTSLYMDRDKHEGIAAADTMGTSKPDPLRVDKGSGQTETGASSDVNAPDSSSPTTGISKTAGAKESKRRAFWTTWWFWTSVGAVVVGGTALTLALTLGGSGNPSQPTSGDVLFRF